MNEQSGRRPYRGRRPSAARVRFLELIELGMTSLQASREVGCNERTGRDWAKGVVKSTNRRYTFDGVLVWEVEIGNSEVVVNADDGSIVKVETDDSDHEDDQDHQDSDHNDDESNDD